MTRKLGVAETHFGDVGSRLHEYVESFECMQTLTRMLPVSAVRSTQCVRRHS